MQGQRTKSKSRLLHWQAERTRLQAKLGQVQAELTRLQAKTTQLQTENAQWRRRRVVSRRATSVGVDGLTAFPPVG